MMEWDTKTAQMSFDLFAEEQEEIAEEQEEIAERREWQAVQLRYLQPCHKCKVKPILSYVDAAHCIRDHLPHYVITCPICGEHCTGTDPIDAWNGMQYLHNWERWE